MSMKYVGTKDDPLAVATQSDVGSPGVSSSRTELLVSDTDAPPVILTNEGETDFFYSD